MNILIDYWYNIIAFNKENPQRMKTIIDVKKLEAMKAAKEMMVAVSKQCKYKFITDYLITFDNSTDDYYMIFKIYGKARYLVFRIDICDCYLAIDGRVIFNKNYVCVDILNDLRLVRKIKKERKIYKPEIYNVPEDNVFSLTNYEIELHDN